MLPYNAAYSGAMAGLSQSDCEERERLRAAYFRALRNWADSGGAEPARAAETNIIAHKIVLDKAVDALIRHRKEHGC